MGKNQKLKEQRKVAALSKEISREKKLRMSGMIIAGIAVGVIFASGVFMGTIYLKNQFFGKKSASAASSVVAQAKTSTNGSRKYSKAPSMIIDTNKTYTAKFETDAGSFEVALAAKDAPKTVNNFVFLAKDHFYDGLTFHRIVKDFMIQGGDPAGTGSGGPGYKFDDEKVVGDYTQGTIAMANSGANTNGSQFFIMTGDYSGGKLPKNYVIFGKVASGLDVVMKLNNTKTSDNGSGEQSKPDTKVVIKKVTIEEK